MSSGVADQANEIAWLRGYLAGRVGVLIHEDRAEMVLSRLTGVMRQRNLPNLTAVAETLRKGDRELLGGVIDALTTHETSFYRDPDVYAWLETEILPKLVSSATGRPLAIWSAACSTGQEPLSVAMTLLENFPHTEFRIAASDVSPGTVERASKCTFPLLEVNRGLPARKLTRWFTRVGIEYQALPELKEKVHFSVHNLLERGGPLGPFDIVLLRNVMIYFSDGDRETIFHNLAHVLRPGGLCVLGTAEALIDPPAGVFKRIRGAKATWLVRE